jgi:predicted nucleic acid-binding protein
MNRILIDTVGFLALWNARDQWHGRAAEVFSQLIGIGADFCTTAYVLLECGNAASRTPFRRDVVEVREQFLADGKLIDPTEADCFAAWAAYEAGTSGEASIVDHVSFAIMRRLEITDVFSNDRHFTAAGFNALF